jgi:hypothetical protein
VAFETPPTEGMTGVGVHRLARRTAAAAGDLEQPLFVFGSHRA